MSEKKYTFESAMARLEEISKLLEEGNFKLDNSIKLVEEATKLSAFCNEQLDKAEQKITLLNKED